MDRATVLGLVATIALVAWVASAGAGRELAMFWQAPSAALVVGGAVLTTLMSASWGRFRTMGGVLRSALSTPDCSAEATITTLVDMAQVARRDGLLALERPVESLPDGFVKRLLRMAVDGADARTIETVSRNEMESTDLRHAGGAGMVESMGRAAPVFGMIGTVIGLVTMVGRMDDPSRIGPGMAVALLTTLYGLVVANVFCAPLARKLMHRSSDELLVRTIAVQGVLAIQSGDHPRVVEQKLRAYLPARAVEAVRAGVPRASGKSISVGHAWPAMGRALWRAPLAGIGRWRSRMPSWRRPGREARAAGGAGKKEEKPAGRREWAGAA